jgi:hypothetical protein
MLRIASREIRRARMSTARKKQFKTTDKRDGRQRSKQAGEDEGAFKRITECRKSALAPEGDNADRHRFMLAGMP